MQVRMAPCWQRQRRWNQAEAGRRIWKVVPLPGWLWTVMAPRCSWMMRRVMSRPRPVPLGLVVKNGSNRRAIFSAEMPMPLSLIVSRSCAPGQRQRRASGGRGAGGEDVRGDREGAVWPHGFEGVEEQIHEGLLQLVIIAVENVGGGLERTVERDQFGFQLGLNEAERVFEDFMQADLAEGGPGGPGEAAHPADNGINAVHFAADDLDQFGVLMFLEEQVDEGLAGDEGILDFVGHAGGEGADAGQAIELLDVLLDLAGGGEVVEDEHDAGVLPARCSGTALA